ncbi:arylformamidase [Halobacillus litoralis]|uniref:Kynurenine formamidase n=1 Tax=Halobacillus litoralis TaxID=45668 RepID=A0A845DVK8_9BACI|nr:MULTISPECIES: arylformamidase [Halobacillus]MYL20342.1 arylformamidase [Halobacillus litoralis]MYL29437.1 arylformamidase [Halobacillus halophilus]
MMWMDISMKLDTKTPPWPGDEPFKYEITYSMEETGSVNVGQFKGSCHIGTHVDAPFHYDSSGSRIADLPVDRFTGRAVVVHLDQPEMIHKEHITDIDLTGVDKILFRTNSWPDRSDFPSAYTVVGSDLAGYLAEHGVDMIGVDTPSVDPETSKELPAHHSLCAHDLLILEGLVLDSVLPGTYELMAFPLKMAEADGSPVRAVLRNL